MSLIQSVTASKGKEKSITNQAQNVGKCLVVKCGKNTASFYPERVKTSGRKLGKCIRFRNKWVTPSEFESMSAVQAKKWKQSIKFNGKPIGDWLAMNESYIDALASQKDSEGSPGNGGSPSLVNEHDNTGIQETCLSQSEQPTYTSNTSDTPENGSYGSMESLESTFTQSSTPATVESGTGEAHVTNTGMSGNYADLFERLEDKLSAGLQSFIRSALSSLRTQLESELNSLKESVDLLQGRVMELENKIKEVTPVRRGAGSDTHVGTPPVLPAVIDKDMSYAEAAAQEQIKKLQSQVQSLSLKQSQLEKEKEREKRKCNVLLGNLPESDDEKEDELREKVTAILSDHLKLTLQPTHILRVGKRSSSKSRLVLVKLKSLKDKLEVLKSAKWLQQTDIFIMEDLSKDDREQRKKLVAAMKKARREGKRAFIRFSDGKLVIDGEMVSCPPAKPFENQIIDYSQ